MTTWERQHRNGVTTLVSTISGDVYVAYMVDGDDEMLQLAQHHADRYAACRRPCDCRPWSEIEQQKAVSS